MAYSLYTKEEVQMHQQNKQTSISDFFPKVERENGQPDGSVKPRPEEVSPEAEILGGLSLNPNASTYKVQVTSEAEVLNCSLISENSDMSQDA